MRIWIARIRAEERDMNGSDLQHFTQLTSRHEILCYEDRITGDSVIDWFQICCQMQKHPVEIPDAVVS